MLDQLTQAENTVKKIQDFLKAAAEETIIQTLEKGKFPCSLKLSLIDICHSSSEKNIMQALTLSLLVET